MEEKKESTKTISFSSSIDGKLHFKAETNDFDQQTACRAPLCWLKYTTPNYSGQQPLKLVFTSLLIFCHIHILETISPLCIIFSCRPSKVVFAGENVC